MRITPRWWIGVLPVPLYGAWVLGTALYQGIDYAEIGAPLHLLPGLIMPLTIAALALIGFLGWSGWTKPVFFEARRVHRPLFLVLLLALMAGCVALNIGAVRVAAIDPRYLGMLALAMLLVGFCEEVLTRGVLLVGLRGSCRSEVLVWFWSSLVFGAMHAMNGLLGVGWMALVQVLFAFCAGTCLYLIRRLTGHLFVPILVHAAWDFSTFVPAAGGAPSPAGAVGLLMVTHLASLILVALFFRHRTPAASRA
ncbi:CPBP family intramembrane glutamic endopeptidase [Luteimonas cellulosilyticus]|nr:CPBP family intramembrane glutamic endopeptidase [Luteimonas cellulosilyticus]